MLRLPIPLSSPISCCLSFKFKRTCPSPFLQRRKNKPNLSYAFLIAPPFSTSLSKCEDYFGFGVGACSVPPSSSNLAHQGLGEEESAIIKTVDVAALGNLCVDVVMNVPSLPPTCFDKRMAFMERLSASLPDKKNLEAGGSCNFSIAAARLGLHSLAIGHVGNEIYGRFLSDVLQEEGIVMIEMVEDTEAANNSSYETLICWVLVDPMQSHGFCSLSDFTSEPVFNWMSELSGQVRMAIKQSKILFCNGNLFDDITPGLTTSALEYAIDAGTAIFFDPGPRGKSLLHGMPAEQKAFKLFLKMSDVLLLTADEAEAITGMGNLILAGQDLMRKGVRTKWVIIKVGPKGSILITTSSISYAPSFKVNVIDTVGCGDSFAAAVAFGFLHDFSPISTLALANAVGAATAMGCGAGRNVANLNRVLELLRVSNLNEDDEVQNELIVENSDATQVLLVSESVMDGCNDQFTRVPMQKVISEVLPTLEAIIGSTVVPS